MSISSSNNELSVSVSKLQRGEREMEEKTEEIYSSSVGFNFNVHNNKKID